MAPARRRRRPSGLELLLAGRQGGLLDADLHGPPVDRRELDAERLQVEEAGQILQQRRDEPLPASPSSPNT